MGSSPWASMRKREDTIIWEILAVGSFMSRARDKNSPERSYVLLLGTPFHYILQKVRGLIEGFI